MADQVMFYIDGEWKTPVGQERVDIVSPVTESVIGKLALGGKEDVDLAVDAARKAFPIYSDTSRNERIALFESVLAVFEARQDILAEAITQEIGAPSALSKNVHVAMALGHLRIALEVLKTFEFDRLQGSTLVRMAPVGVCGLITPWNFPAAVVACKVLPALAAGCTVVLKPSEFAPLSARVLTEIFHDAGVPPGVLNVIYGDGPVVGHAISSHPGVDLVSITGSTRAGVAVATTAAATVKRVHQELGGKSPNIVLPSADMREAVHRCLRRIFMNAGQGCSLPSRLLVPNDRMDEVTRAVREIESEVQPGLPDSNALLGPLVNASQFARVQALIRKGVEDGAEVVIGGPGRPNGFETGYFVKPTVFTNTRPDMAIVREEIFGPVLVIQGYDDIDEAISLANDTDYGLAAYVDGRDINQVREVASSLRAGQVSLNGAATDLKAPFGGFKQSGTGREWGVFGLEAFLEPKAFVGYTPES